uniref:Sugar phosphate transporter domain-containing protein n=1 Tax=Chromera velia CCMP2878 TaxID=1169474 RepID=A0A0G4EY07_9ALVE|mmetsp:Transcript_6303/g.12477  ORF Transcript_6303/g.12477 Transcript_6303/m.12477 type:complete len:365 (+) Transcript_6303:345-1439(+)|eukprot:Cvel_14215.t1-p1 / transcript=Cvel_14215.t1 / gene=Cvel_14215 / organism=Chromera_velia_CCMP2878 / gene_product=Probable sugar phosphate/phosphate translocator, putative / transcript_product=Probable sugar phosphate/phosphate translocator, putative / location=Cvel_scaffold1002:41380-48358(+) / protein_length=364 / sequence_SO=supercontig / SO=protein_coding / is_pseudo=false
MVVMSASSPPPEAGSGGTGAMYLSLWFLANLSITIYGKAAFALFSFPYPIAMTVVHMLFTSIGIHALAFFGAFKPAETSKETWETVLPFSLVFSMNIWLSNASLNAIAVELHQVVRTTIPLFTMAISGLFFGVVYPLSVVPPIMTVMAGVLMTLSGTPTFDTFGLIIAVFSCAVSSLKGIITQRSQVGSLGLSTFQLLYLMAPLAGAELFVLSVLTGEFRQILENDNVNMETVGHLTTLGVIAFGLNVLSFKTAGVVQPLTMNVAGALKEVTTSVLGILIFGGVFGFWNVAGILTAAVGAFMYGLAMKQMKAPQSDSGGARRLSQSGGDKRGPHGFSRVSQGSDSDMEVFAHDQLDDLEKEDDV